MDMTYAGKKLSDFGFMIGGLDSKGGVEQIPTDSQRTFGQISMFYGAYQPFVYSIYESSLEMEFAIIKNPCSEGYTTGEITQAEVRAIKRWLNRPMPHKLTFDKEGFEDTFWEGSFNVEETYMNDGVYGLTLTFHSNRPFGLYTEVDLNGTLESMGATSLKINDTSDEEGYIYPTLEVTCNASGDLELYNSYDEDRATIVKNCTEGEKIVFTAEMQIRSSIDTHEVGDDFNYRFLRIGNTYDNNENVITSSLPITYRLRYNPIAKAVIA